MEPSLFINVFQYRQTVSEKNGDGALVKKSVTVDMPHEHAVITDREEAVRHAEEFADYYIYTLTEQGVIDLSDEFSEGYQAQRDFDAHVDARIDEMKDDRFAREALSA